MDGRKADPFEGALRMESDMAEKSRRGFAAMDEAKQRAIAAKGGRSVPDEKRSFSRDRGLAAEAGAKGGQSVPDEKRSFSLDRELAAEAGRKGGHSVPDEKRSFSQNRNLASAAGRKGGHSRSSAAYGTPSEAGPRKSTSQGSGTKRAHDESDTD